MLILEPRHVYMQQTAEDKTTALKKLCEILQQDGLATEQYFYGLEQRERQSATYLGQGIAIPHGTPESRDEILQNGGVRLVHFPQGVVWTEQGDVVYLAVVIAAKSDEHLHILQLLTKALGEQDLSTALQQATTPEQILGLLQAHQPNLFKHESLIKTQVQAHDIDDVVLLASQMLKQAQCVDAGFITGLNADSAVALQDNIWCITGHHYVQQSAVSIVHLAKAIDFKQKKLQVLVCVASHRDIDKRQLAQLIQNLCQIQVLDWSNPLAVAEWIGAETTPQWTSQSVTLANAHGLHARPATALAQLCQQFDGEILVSVEQGASVSAKSLIKLLALGALRGQVLTFMAQPNTMAEQHLGDIIQAVEQGLGEEIEPVITPSAERVTSVIINESVTNQNTLSSLKQANKKVEPLQVDVCYQGVSASSGLAVGVAHLVKAQQFDFSRFAQQEIDDELADLGMAIQQAIEQLALLIKQAKTQDIANIFHAHQALLQDEDLLADVQSLIIHENLSAAAAWQQHIEQTAQTQANLNNALLAERADDLRDIGQRVLAILCDEQVVSEPSQPYVLVKYDLMPSDVARLDKNKVVGILTAVGGSSSHSAIVARALAIPAVVGAGEMILDIEPTSQILLDGEQGQFYIQPNAERVQQALTLQQQQAEQRQVALHSCALPAMTNDAHLIEVASNLGDVHHTAQAVEFGADAVGLLRTELVFMSHSAMPSEQQQERDYRVVFDALAGRPLVVRTLDVGGDKPLPYVPMEKEENPFLGIRGMRLTLRQPELLRSQLRALIRAADNRPLRIMFPMIGRVEEWREAKAILDEILQELPCPNLQVGMMIEVPSAVLMTPILAQEVDFFSIGTNDLTQYVLAIDRGHAELSKEADALHPSILMMINHTVKFAHRYGKWVGVCGELAGEHKAVPILLGLGVDELSMSPNQIPLVKAQIRGLNFTKCQEMAKQSLECATADEVRQLASDFLVGNWQETSAHHVNGV